MQTSLQGIAGKSALHRDHRFQNLMGLIGTGMLYWCWKLLNRKSAPGVDRVTYWQYGERLTDNVTNLVERVKGGWYRAKLVMRRFIPKIGGKMRPPWDFGHGRQAAANSGGEDTGSDIRADIYGRQLWV